MPDFRLRFVRALRSTVSIPNVVDVLCYDNKSRKMEVVGRKDRLKEADVFREISSISNKLQRFSNGDVTALNSVKGIYTDISGIPTDYNTMHNVVRSAMVDSISHGFSNIPDYIQSLIKPITSDPKKPITSDPKKPITSDPKEAELNESK